MNLQTTTPMTHPAVPASEPDGIARGPSLRPVRTFALVTLPVGWAILSIPLLLGLPTEPFAMLAALGALLAPALLITRREAGGAGVRALLRDAVRLPRPLWWGLAAATVIPAVTWLVAAALGAAQPLTLALVVGPTGYLVNLVLSAVLVNIWEETAWTGFVQRRLAARLGVVRASVVTAALFVAIHLPLIFQGPITTVNLLLGLAVLIGTGIGLRLIIGYLDGWTAGSLLSIGVLHASFNGTAGLIDESHDWLRLTVTFAIGLAIAVVWRRRR